MRWILATLLLPLSAAAFDQNHTALDQLLQKHVKKGLVDYRGLAGDHALLKTYLQEAAAVTSSEFKTWSSDEQLAFLINVYNADTLAVVLENQPLKSILDLNGGKGPWKEPRVRLLGRTVSLDALEHEIIRKDYDEPRIHFALVCAAVGCPPLLDRAFIASKLDQQLAKQTADFLNQSDKNRRDGDTLHLSPIFDWYGEDFPGGPARWVAPWLGEGKRVRFTDYDWDLNQS